MALKERRLGVGLDANGKPLDSISPVLKPFDRSAVALRPTRYQKSPSVSATCWQEEARPTRDGTVAIRRDAAAGHDAV